jgi:uncharacterized membrane protein
LCDQAREDLAALQPEFPHQLVEINIDSDPDLRKKYLEMVPVAQIGPYKLEALFTQLDLRVALGAAQDSVRKAQESSRISREHAIRLNQAVLFFTRHWLGILNVLIFIYVATPFSVPLLMKAGATGPALLIDRLYAPWCHQLAYRSWFIFGEQAAYPLEIAGTNLTSYQAVTGLDGDDYYAAEDFLGNEKVGFKVVLCQRDVAMWGGMLVAGMVFGLVRDRLRPLPILLWLIFGVFPIALDGGTQLLSLLPLHDFPVRESTPFLRTLTGTLFGVMNVWMAFPYIEESMSETRLLIASKLARASQKEEAV